MITLNFPNLWLFILVMIAPWVLCGCIFFIYLKLSNMFNSVVNKMTLILEKSTKDNIEFIRQAYEAQNEKLPD